MSLNPGCSRIYVGEDVTIRLDSLISQKSARGETGEIVAVSETLAVPGGPPIEPVYTVRVVMAGRATLIACYRHEVEIIRKV